MTECTTSLVMYYGKHACCYVYERYIQRFEPSNQNILGSNPKFFLSMCLFIHKCIQPSCVRNNVMHVITSLLDIEHKI